MWAGNFENAINLYQTYLDFEVYPQQYATFRMGIAQILYGQMTDGIARLRQLQTEQLGETSYTLLPLVTQVLNAYDNNPSPFAICIAAYDYFAFNAYTVWFNESLEVGFTIDNMIYALQGMHSPRAPTPDQAGCDLPAQLEQLLTTTIFTTVSSPIAELGQAGLVTDMSYEVDLNNDGVQDWLVFLPTIRIPPILFLSDDQTYTISRPLISYGYPLNDENTLLTVNLPDDNGVALLNVDYSEHFQTYPLGYGLGGGPGSCPASGYIQLWRLVDAELVSALLEPMCAVVDPIQTIDNTNNMQEIYTWAFSNIAGDFVPVTYIWDSINQTYLIPQVAEITLTPQEQTRSTRYRVLGPIFLYLRQDYELLLEIRDEVLIDITDSSDETLLVWRYVSALTYEQLNRPDEALAEYITIYESAPESAWGMLARLHLEIVD